MSGFLNHSYLSLCSVGIYRKYHADPVRHFGSGILLIATDLKEDVLGEDSVMCSRCIVRDLSKGRNWRNFSLMLLGHGKRRQKRRPTRRKDNLYGTDYLV